MSMSSLHYSPCFRPYIMRRPARVVLSAHTSEPTIVQLISVTPHTGRRGAGLDWHPFMTSSRRHGPLFTLPSACQPATRLARRRRARRAPRRNEPDQSLAGFVFTSSWRRGGRRPSSATLIASLPHQETRLRCKRARYCARRGRRFFALFYRRLMGAVAAGGWRAAGRQRGRSRRGMMVNRLAAFLLSDGP